MPRRAGLLSLLLALLAACSTIDRHEKVAGWPELRIVEHYVDSDSLLKRCSKYTSFGFLPEACAEFDFVHAECHVWYFRDYPPMKYVIEHERLHCQGYDHPGATTLRDILARYEAQKRAAAAKPPAPAL